ncbi:MAG: VWA domain-containing protein [Spirosomataceae bacterium]
MNWINNLSQTEYIFIALFVLMYLIYVIKVWWVVRQFGSSIRSVLIKFLIRTTYMGLVIGAILGPTIGSLNRTSQALGKDLFIAVDLSNSMNADDVRPSRLERGKFELLKLINQLDDSRIGLFVFTSEAFILTPLTYDKSALKLFIQQLNTHLIVDNGTSFNSILDAVAHKFSKATYRDRFVKSLLILTDGEDFEPLPDSTVKAINQQHINIFFWGVGTVEGSRIPLQTGGFLKDNQGDEVVSKLNTVTIQSILNKTSGSYFRLNQSQNDVNAIIDELAKLRNTRIDERKFMVENNRYAYFLWIALLLIVIDIVLTVRIVKV